MTRLRRIAIVAGVLGLVAAGCSGGDEASGTTLKVVVADGLIRPEGAECGGSRPFRDIHEGVTYAVIAADGTELVTGTLPPGHAENADPTVDWEDLERIPTVCAMELAVGELADHPAYELRIEGAEPLPFAASDVAVGTPIVLLIGQ